MATNWISINNEHLTHPCDEVMQTMARIYRYRMTTTSGGNLSIRDENGDVWISPARVDKGNRTRNDIVSVKADGSIEGMHPPSSEFPFHQEVYEARPDIRAIVHAHPVALVAFSMHVDKQGKRLDDQPGPRQHGFDFFQTQIEQQPLRGRMGQERTLFRQGGTVLIRNDQQVGNDDPYYAKHLTDANGDFAVDLIKKFAAEDKPFFLNLWWLVPHKPYEPAPEPHWSNTAADGISEDQHCSRSMVQHMDAIHHPFTPAKRFQGTSQCGLYGDSIHELDWIVGEVLSCLE
jgi:hypothetical protein